MIEPTIIPTINPPKMNNRIFQFTEIFDIWYIKAKNITTNKTAIKNPMRAYRANVKSKATPKIKLNKISKIPIIKPLLSILSFSFI